MAGGRILFMQKVMLLAATMAVVFAGVCSAKTYTVGDSTGWTIPPSSSFYSTWASKQSLQTGDVLVFNFPQGIHTVAPVSKAAYDGCDIKTLLSTAITVGPANIPLNTTGTHYFICTIPTHCNAGQKLAVTVHPTASTAPTTSPSSTTTSAPPPAKNFATPIAAGISFLSMAIIGCSFAIMF